MPIDYKDGRHWCAPSREHPDADGNWTCTCGQVWHTTDKITWEREQ